MAVGRQAALQLPPLTVLEQLALQSAIRVRLKEGCVVQLRIAQLPVTAHEFVSLQVAVNPGPAALAAQGVLQVLLIKVPMQLVMPAVLLVVLGQATLFVAAGGRFVHVLSVQLPVTVQAPAMHVAV